MLARRTAFALLGIVCATSCSASPPPAEPAPESTGAATSVPFDVVDNRIFVDVRIDDSEPLRFILDTGGSWVVDTAVARALGLPKGQSIALGGAGPGKQSAHLTRLSRVAVGDVVQRDQRAVVIDLGPIRRGIGFERFDGVVGAELLSEYVAEIDYATRTLRLWSPDRFDDRGAGAVIPFELHRGKPLVRARVDGIPARLVVDTGDRSCVTLNRPFVARHRLAESYPLSDPVITGIGIGGEIVAPTTRIRRVELGGVHIANPLARLPAAATGIFAAEDFDGTLGNGALQARRLYIDYPQKRFIVDAPAPPRCPEPLAAHPG